MTGTNYKQESFIDVVYIGKDSEVLDIAKRFGAAYDITVYTHLVNNDTDKDGLVKTVSELNPHFAVVPENFRRVGVEGDGAGIEIAEILRDRHGVLPFLYSGGQLHSKEAASKGLDYIEAGDWKVFSHIASELGKDLKEERP